MLGPPESYDSDMALLDPFRPTASTPWDVDAAAHLARRAGFGAAPAELGELVELGPQRAAERFLDWPDDDAELERRRAAHGAALADPVAGEDGAAAAVARLRVTALWRMARTRWPLREKLALLWHDHFPTAESKVVRYELLRDQHELFRRRGRGTFRELLHAVARDPAMLVYLDNRVSERERPNENWGRELLELFTLGVGHYEQRDVREAARVFTGWTTPDRNRGPFRFDAGLHDRGDKRVLGRLIEGRTGKRGVGEGEELLDLLAEHPSCARTVATKLASAFVAERPASALVDELAERFEGTGGSIRELLRTLLASAAFHAPEARFALHRSPVDWTVAAVRLLGVRNPHLLGLPERSARMGLQLFEPPSVAGWDAGRAWVRTSAVVERFDLALTLATLPHSKRAVHGAAAADFDALSPAESTDGIVADLERRLLQRPLGSQARAAIVEHVEETVAERRERVRGAVHMVLCTPEFALG